jgi:RNA polymerase II subunit A-like phosphatase
MAHDHTQLTVSHQVTFLSPVLTTNSRTNHYNHQEAQRLEAQTTTRLLSAQKLSLIVDLDQTIIHATVDRSVQDWLDDPSHPNHNALVGTERFQLGAVLGEAEDPYWYYVKPR